MAKACVFSFFTDLVLGSYVLLPREYGTCDCSQGGRGCVGDDSGGGGDGLV